MSPGRATTRLRLDVVLVDRGLAPSRAKAQALILAGLVTSGGRRLDKPGVLVANDVPIELAPGRRYVGRGGGKLVPALARFGIPVDGRDAVDVGASTGGFTQVLLEAGARRVIALDVGRGQLDWSLRNDPRVVVLEGVNARLLNRGDLPFAPSIAVIDVSFIGLARVLSAVTPCLAEEPDIVALVKPQFEVGRGRVGKGGIVRDPAAWDDVLLELLAFSQAGGLSPQGIARSEVPGAEGNVEFFLWLRPGAPAREQTLLDLQRDEAVHGRPPTTR